MNDLASFPAQVAALRWAIRHAHPQSDTHAGLVAALKSIEALRRLVPETRVDDAKVGAALDRARAP